jgi:hypothetical protein
VEEVVKRILISKLIQKKRLLLESLIVRPARVLRDPAGADHPLEVSLDSPVNEIMPRGQRF